MTKASKDDMRNANLLTLLQCIQHNAPISKNELKELTGLSWGTVSGLTSELTRKGVIIEGTRSVSMQVGRTPALASINPNYCYAIGLELNTDGITVALMNLKLEIEEMYSEPIRDNAKASVLSQSFHVLDTFLDSIGSKKDRLLGIGISMQGIVDSIGGISVYSPYFSDWSNVNLKQIYSDRYHINTYLEHSPICQALYEKQIGVGKGLHDIVYIRASSGIGMCIMINDTVIRGADGNAGEFGHIIVEPNGRQCACGKRGCLETVASTKALIEMAQEHVQARKDTMLISEYGVTDPKKIDMELIYNAACRGDAFCLGLFRNVGKHLGAAISTLINIMNPRVIILGGALAQYESLFTPTLTAVLEERVWAYSNRSILYSRSRQNTAVIGAALNVINRFYVGEYSELFSFGGTK